MLSSLLLVVVVVVVVAAVLAVLVYVFTVLSVAHATKNVITGIYEALFFYFLPTHPPPTHPSIHAPFSKKTS